ncbi:MAG: DNA double-strand break repair nuclease NurA [Candidatus Thorarchaeota archaeon]
MPEFLDDLIQIIRNNKEKWIRTLSGELDPGFLEHLKNLVVLNWHPLPIEEANPPDHVMGTDGSRAARGLSNGAVWWLARSIALSRNKKRRVFESGFLPRGVTEQESQWYLTLRMEDAENQVALKGAKELTPEAILIDGSLFGRLQHIPVELKIPGAMDYLLIYYKNLLDLLDYCSSRKITLVGVSKDSKVDYFTKFLFMKKVKQIAQDSEGKTSTRMLLNVLNAIMQPNNPEGATESLVEELRSKKDRVWNNMAEILQLASLQISDHHLMQSMVHGKGYTTPLLLSVSEHLKPTFENAFRNPDNFASMRFKKSLAASKNPGEYKENATRILTRLRNLPSVVSFHVRLHHHDTPLRVDILGWSVGERSSVWDIMRPKEFPCDLTKIMTVLVGGYGGLQNYNIWLKRADELARLPRETVDNLYRIAVEKELGFRIEFRRGYRRVYYP